MAKIIYELRKNMNTASKTYGQWYAHVKTVETMNTRKGISGTVLTDHFSRQMKMKQKSIQTISKCWTSENDRENRPRESVTFQDSASPAFSIVGTYEYPRRRGLGYRMEIRQLSVAEGWRIGLQEEWP